MPCTACGAPDIKVHQDFCITGRVNADTKQIPAGKENLTFAMVYCEHCGYTQFFTNEILQSK